MPLVYPTCHPRAEGEKYGYESSDLVHFCSLHELIHLRAFVMQEMVCFIAVSLQH